MKTGKIITLLMAFVLMCQVLVFAESCQTDTPPTASLETDAHNPTPYGTYLWTGKCTLSPENPDSVVVHGTTDCYGSVDEVGVTFHLYRLEGGIWVECWKETYSGYNTYWYSSPYITVYTGPGQYKLQVDHFCRWGLNGYEENSSNADPITVQ